MDINKYSKVYIMDNKKNTCNICNKDYKTYKSMWHHKNKYHTENKPKVSQILAENKPDINQNKSEMDNIETKKKIQM